MILKRVKYPTKDFSPAGLPVDPEPGGVSDERHWQKPWQSGAGWGHLGRKVWLREAGGAFKSHLYKKDLHDPDNHNGVITDIEPDILECEVKGALESITTNKASGGDGIPVELFQIRKDDAVKVLLSICSKFGKLSSGHRTGKGQFSFQSQRKAMPKNAQTTTQLHSSHRQVK